MNRVLLPPRRAPPHGESASHRPHLPTPSRLDVRSSTLEFSEGTNIQTMAASYFTDHFSTTPAVLTVNRKLESWLPGCKQKCVSGSVSERGSWGNCGPCTPSGPTPDAQGGKSWGRPSRCTLTSPPEGSDARYSLRTSAPRDEVQTPRASVSSSALHGKPSSSTVPHLARPTCRTLVHNCLLRLCTRGALHPHPRQAQKGMTATPSF